MHSPAEETAPLYWVVFIVAVIFFLALDLGVFHRQARAVRVREALAWTAVWIAIALLFGLALAPAMVPSWGRQHTFEFITGYLIELSLSMDNVFVIALIFGYFRVPQLFQHRVLFWGILGALVMRGVMIWLGVELIHRFSWMFYVLGVFLIFTGIKMVFLGHEEVNPEKNLVIRLTRQLFAVSADYDGQRFVTRLDGRRVLTPLALVLVTVESSDLIFAVDSIPAIFAVTQDAFIVFTSNVFAILGLRSLYFVLAGAIRYFRFLKIGLSIVLVFIGVKMLLNHTAYEVSIGLSLAVVAGIILISMLLSILTARKEPSA
jgi:tellurite resistance protein TerC